MAGIPQVITEDRASGAQFIDGSLTINGSNQYLTRTHTASNTRTWTFSCWVKKQRNAAYHQLFTGFNTGANQSGIIFMNDDTLRIYSQGGLSMNLTTSAVYRDSGWMNVVVAVDTTIASPASDRVKLWVNGTRVTDFGTATYPSQNDETYVNTNITHYVGSNQPSSNTFYGQYAQAYFIDGQQLDESYFGYNDPLTNTWRPKKYTGSFNTAAVPGTTYAAASGGKPFVNTTNEGQTLGSGYVSGATTNAILLVPGYNLTEEGSSNSISNINAQTTTTSKWYGNAIEFGTAAQQGNVQKCLSYGTALGLSGASNFTFEAWVYPRAGSNGYNMLFEGDWQSNHGILFRLTSAYKPELQFGNGGFQTFTSDFALTPDQWSHVAIVCDNNTMRFFVNGTMDVKGTRTMNYTVGNGYRYIGAYRDSNHYSAPRAPFYGYMQDIRLTSDVKYNASFTVPGGGAVPAGVNGFYLPLDGNTLTGKDQSGNGNDWTAIGCGTQELPKATGAIPVLNTNDAGTVAKRGVRTDSKTYTVTASGGNYYLDGALKPTLNAYRGGSYTFDYTGATSHPFYLSSLQDGKWNSKAYSVQFDGSGDYLSVPSSSDFDFGSGDCTVECFVYITSHAGDKTIIGSWEGTTSWQLSYGADSGNDRFAFMMHDGSSTLAAISSFQSTNYVNQWVHLAGVRHGNWLKVYVNGIFGGERSISGAHTTFNAPLTIGGRSNGNQVTGYVSNVRVVKGTALYTAAFEPPNTTLTNVTGTTLLCCQDSAATTAAVIPSGSITVAGNSAAIQSKQPFLYDNNHGNFGLNLATSNTTKITIPHTAADTLYYYCNAHSGMGSSINVTTDIFKADPYAWKCMFAMASDTIDHSPEINVNSTATSFGDIHTTTPQGLRNLYGYSKKMENGGGFRIDMELTTAEANAKHKFDTNDFTLECWFYQDGAQTSWQSLFRSASYNNPSGTGSDGIAFYGNAQTLFPYSVVSGSGQQWGQTGDVVPYKKWNHAAWTRQGGVNRIFANGILVKTFNNSNSWDNKGWEIGDVYTWNGGYQDARIYNGVAKYTESFIVPATEPDILPDTPSGITGKTNLTKITDGAVHFDGSGDYLSVSDSNDWDIGTNPFTIECFVNINPSSTSYSGIFGMHTGSTQFQWRINNVGRLQFLQDFGGTRGNENDNDTSGTDLRDNSWHHVALTRQSDNSWQLYVDGIVEYSGTGMTGNVTGINEVALGRRVDNNSNYLTGYISNLRFVSGTALYSSDFTPPTEPLTAVTNTKLLCCQSTTSATAAAVTPGSITANGDAAATNFNPFTDDINTIRGQASGYCTWNPLTKSRGNLSDGNLLFYGDGTNTPRINGTISQSSGKWYYEAIVLNDGPGTGSGDVHNSIGWGWDTVSNIETAPNTSAMNHAFYFMDSGWYKNFSGSNTNSSTGKWLTGDVIGVAADLDNNILTFYKNGIEMLSQTIGTTAGTSLCPAHQSNTGTYGRSISNFGQKPFKFPPPDGFQPLSLSNVQPEKVIARPDQYVSAITYSGNNSSSNTVTDLKFNSKPDFVWIKSRSGSSSPGSQNHYLVDSVRGANGASGTSKLYSNNNGAANSGQTATTNGVRFTHNGFELTTNNDGTNSNNNYVAWCWKAGGSKGTFNVDDVGYANASDVNMNVGALNSVTFDKSQNWTSQITGTENGSYPFSNLFNGDGQATHAYPANGTRATFTPSPSFSNAKTVKVWYYAPTINANTFQLNGVNVGDQMTTTGGTLTKTFNVDGFTSWSWSKGIGGDDSGMLRIDVDGVQLVDSGVSTPNVPSMTATGCSVGTKQGFSIVRYTGSGSVGTLAHGLGQKPTFWLVKSIDAATYPNWYAYTEQLDGSLDFMHFHTNEHKFNSSAAAPTSTTIGITATLGQAVSWIAYMWHDVPGLQKFGSFTGNSSENFVELGFRPAVVWVKRAIANSSSDTSTNNSAWTIMDSTRLSYNGQTPNHLYANHTADEGKRGDGSGTSSLGDMTLEPHSNGFYLNGPATETNSNTGKFLYCAWAEAPAVNLYGAQSNAR